MREEINESDLMLGVLARGGDRDAFGKLVARYFGTVWSIAYARLGQRDSADDLAQEVFLVAFLHLQSLSDAGRFGGWLSQITHHRAIDWIRQKQRHSKLVAMVPVESLQNVGVAQEESTMERSEQDEAVRQALFELPAEQREIVLLKFAEGLNQKEIAERLEVHPGTISRNLDAALGALRKSLGGMMDESVGRLRAPKEMAMKTSALVGAVGMMSAAHRAAMVAACGHVPGWAGVTGNVIGKGAGTMSTFKGVAMVMGILLAGCIGAILYEQSVHESGQPAMASTLAAGVAGAGSASQTGAGATTEPAAVPPVLAAQRECFPVGVLGAAVMGSKAISAGFPGDLDVWAQAHAVDHLGAHWLGYYYQRVGDGTSRTFLGDFDRARLIGVITDEGKLLPVQFSPGRRAGTQRVAVRFDGTWARGEVKRFGLMMSYDSMKADANGLAKMTMGNRPGVNALQQFILVGNKAWGLQSSSEPPVSTIVMTDYTIYFWQKRVKPQEGYQVDVVMKGLDQGK